MGAPAMMGYFKVNWAPSRIIWEGSLHEGLSRLGCSVGTSVKDGLNWVCRNAHHCGRRHSLNRRFWAVEEWRKWTEHWHACTNPLFSSLCRGFNACDERLQLLTALISLQ